MYCKIFIRTFPSTEECDLFESILQTKWPELIKKPFQVWFSMPTEINSLQIFQLLYGNSRMPRLSVKLSG